jgi:recombination protein RecR
VAQNLAGPEIERLIQLLARVPGLGPRSARRAVLHLMKKREDLLHPLGEAMRIAAERIVTCSECGNLDTTDPCSICRDPRRDPSIIIVVESVGDLWALERAAALRAAYHVLGGTLSPMDGIGPEDLALGKLLDRASRPDVRKGRQPRSTSPTCSRDRR